MADLKPRPTAEERLAKLEAKEKEIEKTRQAVKAKIRSINADKKKKDRKGETRKKILLGAWLLKSETEKEIRSIMDSYLTIDKDRALFNLEPLKKEEPEPINESNQGDDIPHIPSFINHNKEGEE